MDNYKQRFLKLMTDDDAPFAWLVLAVCILIVVGVLIGLVIACGSVVVSLFAIWVAR